MRISIVAVGKLRSGPERDLSEDYLTRFARAGRVRSLGPASIVEVEDRKGGGAKAEAQLLLSALPPNAKVFALDERGKTLSSPQFAERLKAEAEQGARELAILIGGADGLTEEIRSRADLLVSFGPMVWPHKLVRVMLAEQLYRAASILSGSPYHRA
ncbi:MAG: 23S rRNA (pseudouridine(1915)-N(3))-methyltransferase RlmH [Pseudomonadota bacterium]